jgi:hypothetical protein
MQTSDFWRKSDAASSMTSEASDGITDFSERARR